MWFVRSRLENTRYWEKLLSYCEPLLPPVEATRYGRHRVARGDSPKKTLLGLRGVHVDDGKAMVVVGFWVLASVLLLPPVCCLVMRCCCCMMPGAEFCSVVVLCISC